jgi:hypothetical protein
VGSLLRAIHYSFAPQQVRQQNLAHVAAHLCRGVGGSDIDGRPDVVGGPERRNLDEMEGKTQARE